jgi:hypothetical protein
MRTSISKRERYETLRRCEFACFYCGAKVPDVTLQIDHVVPVSRGGTNDGWNLVAACAECNMGKLDGTPLETTVQQAQWLWQAYVPGRIDAYTHCSMCGRPSNPEDPIDQADENDCYRCLDSWWQAYNQGVEDGRAAERDVAFENGRTE